MRTIEFPDSVSEEEITKLLSVASSKCSRPIYRPNAITDRQSVRANNNLLPGARILRLKKMWKKYSKCERGREIRLILAADSSMSKTMLANELGVSPPVVGYHYRFTFLSQQQQNDIDSGKLPLQEAIKLASNAETSYSNPAPAEIISDPMPVTATLNAPVEETKTFGDYDAAYVAFRDWIGWYGEPVACAPRAEQDLIKRIVINDTHIPYMDEASFKSMVEAEAGDTDELVIAGDLATMTYFAAFPKFSRTYTPVEGFFATTKFVQYVNEMFPKVTIFSGNHDARFIKWLVRDRGIPPEVLEYFELLAPGFTDPLKIICKDLQNITVLDPIEYERAKFAFLYQFGDFVVGHAETYSKIPLRAGTNFAHWLKSFAEPCGIVGRNSAVGQDFRCVGQAHTHQAGKVFGDYALWDFELGCMCDMEEYVGDPKIRGARPWVKGYTRVWQDRETGRTLINDTNFVHTGRF